VSVRKGKSVRKSKRLTVLTVAITVAGVAGLAGAGCGRSTGGPAARHPGTAGPIGTITTSVPAAVAVPKGWKTDTDGQAAISVPASWAVTRHSNCPDAAAPGTLLLGYPQPLEYCPGYRSMMSYVALIDPADGADGGGSWSVARQKPEMINGVEVYPGFGSPAALEWMAPSLGLEIIGTGPMAESIVATLRRS
jgi:hypothetical protein